MIDVTACLYLVGNDLVWGGNQMVDTGERCPNNIPEQVTSDGMGPSRKGAGN